MSTSTPTSDLRVFRGLVQIPVVVALLVLAAVVRGSVFWWQHSIYSATSPNLSDERLSYLVLASASVALSVAFVITALGRRDDSLPRQMSMAQSVALSFAALSAASDALSSVLTYNDLTPQGIFLPSAANHGAAIVADSASAVALVAVTVALLLSWRLVSRRRRWSRAALAVGCAVVGLRRCVSRVVGRDEGVRCLGRCRHHSWSLADPCGSGRDRLERDGHTRRRARVVGGNLGVARVGVDHNRPRHNGRIVRTGRPRLRPSRRGVRTRGADARRSVRGRTSSSSTT